MNNCLYCKHPRLNTLHTQITDEFQLETVKCHHCGKTWKDISGVNNETSPIISIQRNIGSSDSKPVKSDGNDKLPENNKNN